MTPLITDHIGGDNYRCECGHHFAQYGGKMPDIKVQINPLDIEEAIVKSVIASSFGKTIKEIIDKELNDLTSIHRRGSLRVAIEGEI